MRTVEWQDGKVRMIDQKRIPWELVLVDLPDYQAVAAAITDMTVRGAPAIGAAAGFDWRWRDSRAKHRPLTR